MQIKSSKTLLIALFGLTVLSAVGPIGRSSHSNQLLVLPEEKHLKNIKQLTFGGENAEAYFSSDGKKLIFQSTRDGRTCDQIYTMYADGGIVRMVSTGDGRTTCGYFFPNGQRVLYSSTHLGAKECPPRPDFSKGYVWAVY